MCAVNALLQHTVPFMTQITNFHVVSVTRNHAAGERKGDFKLKGLLHEKILVHKYLIACKKYTSILLVWSLAASSDNGHAFPFTSWCF